MSSSAQSKSQDHPRRWRWLLLLLAPTLAAYALVVVSGVVVRKTVIRRLMTKALTIDAQDIAGAVTTASPDEMDAGTRLTQMADNAAVEDLQRLLESLPEDNSLPPTLSRDLGRIRRMHTVILDASDRLCCGSDLSRRNMVKLAPAATVVTYLYARHRASDGDLSGALDEIEAIFRLAELVNSARSSIAFYETCQAGHHARMALRRETAALVARTSNATDAARVRHILQRLCDERATAATWQLDWPRIDSESLSRAAFERETEATTYRELFLPSWEALKVAARRPAELDEQVRDRARIVEAFLDPSVLMRSRSTGQQNAAEAWGVIRKHAGSYGYQSLAERLMEDRITACVLAAALYARDHGVPPVTLHDFVPEYLPSAPFNLFSWDGELVQMTINGTRLQFDGRGPGISGGQSEEDLESYPSLHAEFELGNLAPR